MTPIEQYFTDIQEYIKSETGMKDFEVEQIINELNKDNIMAVINQEYSKNTSIEECVDLILKTANIKGGIDIEDGDKLDGDRALNTMEKKVLNFTEFVNEKKTINRLQ